MTTLAILHSTVRKEEKLIAEAANQRNIRVKLIDIREEIFNPHSYKVDYDIALERSVSTVKGTYAVNFLESLGIKVVNSLEVALNCTDKFTTCLLLRRANVPTPKFALAFSLPQSVQAVEELGGFPVVIKPPLGSWGRLLSKVNDMDALEAVLEHKDVLGTPPQKAFYIQEFVPKHGRDIRAFVVGGETICAIYRESSHWISNTARGAVTRNCPVNDGLRTICGRASKAVGDGLLAIDLFEDQEGYLVNEINHTMEFRNSEEPTGVSISGAIVDYCYRQLESKK